MQQRFLLQILLLAQHVSGTTLPIIRSSRVFYSGPRVGLDSCGKSRPLPGFDPRTVDLV